MSGKEVVVKSRNDCDSHSGSTTNNKQNRITNKQTNKNQMNKLSTQEMLDVMKLNGYPAEIIHYRILNKQNHPTYKKMVLTYRNNRFKLKHGKKPEYATKGGETYVFFKTAENFLATCSDQDNFCFKTGANLAVSRAYAFYLEHGVEKSHGVNLMQKSYRDEPDNRSPDFSEYFMEDRPIQTVYVIATLLQDNNPLFYCGGPYHDDVSEHVKEHGLQKREIIDNPIEYTEMVRLAQHYIDPKEAQKYVFFTDEKIYRYDVRETSTFTLVEK